VDAAVRLGSVPWQLVAQAALARTWAAGGDHDQAAELAARVEQDAAAIGMRHLRGLLRSAAARPPAVDSPRPTDAAGGAAAAPPAPETAAPVFRRNGAVWRLGFAGHVAHIPDSKGLRDLHT